MVFRKSGRSQERVYNLKKECLGLKGKGNSSKKDWAVLGKSCLRLRKCGQSLQ